MAKRKSSKPASYRVGGKRIPRARLTRHDAYATAGLAILSTPAGAGAYLGARHLHNRALNRGYAAAASGRKAPPASRRVHGIVGARMINNSTSHNMTHAKKGSHKFKANGK